VLEWLTWAAAGGLARHVSDSHLEQLSAHLGSRTFLAGNALSLADLVVFALVHAAVVSVRRGV
jgi:glutathione S-transferase